MCPKKTPKNINFTNVSKGTVVEKLENPLHPIITFTDQLNLGVYMVLKLHDQKPKNIIVWPSKETIQKPIQNNSCEICKHKFTTTSNYRAHLRDVHAMSYKKSITKHLVFVCDYCFEPFKGLHTLKDHQTKRCLLFGPD